LVPFEGYLVDRFGPKLLVAVGGVLVGLSWLLNSTAADLWMLYVGMAVGEWALASSTAPPSAAP
jgi:MFS transporter, OFA family, oxalate/formate antiporter